MPEKKSKAVDALALRAAFFVMRDSAPVSKFSSLVAVGFARFGQMLLAKKFL